MTGRIVRQSACYIRAVPKHPSQLKVKRAKAFIDSAGRKILTPCGLCGEGKYIVEGEGVCDECRSHGGKIRVVHKRKTKILKRFAVTRRAAPTAGRAAQEATKVGKMGNG